MLIYLTTVRIAPCTLPRGAGIIFALDSYSDRTLVLCTIVHNADLGNPTKTWEICKEWTERLMEEFFEEGALHLLSLVTAHFHSTLSRHMPGPGHDPSCATAHIVDCVLRWRVALFSAGYFLFGCYEFTHLTVVTWPFWCPVSLLPFWFGSGDEERAMGLALGALNDRSAIAIPKCQIGFLSFVAMPLWKAWSDYLTAPHTQDETIQLTHLKENLAKWEALAACSTA